MKVVPHQAIGVHLKTGLLTGFRQRLEKVLAIDIIVENVLPPVPAAHHVVDRPRILDANLARHD